MTNDTDSFIIEKCKVNTKYGKELCDCLKEDKNYARCMRKTIIDSKGYIYVFGTGRAGKSSFWRKYYAEPKHTNKWGDVAPDLEKAIKEERIEDEEGYELGQGFADSFFTTHNLKIILGDRKVDKQGIGILIERDPDILFEIENKMVKELKDKYPDHPEVTIDDILKYVKEMRDLSEISKNDIIFIRNLNGNKE